MTSSDISSAVERRLEAAGFSQAGPDTWGKVSGDLTLFLETGLIDVNSEGKVSPAMQGWLFDSKTESFAGPRVELVGDPNTCVGEALRHFEGLLHEDTSASLLRSMSPTKERYVI